MSQLTQVTARLLAAYERLAHGDRINSGADFRAYCERWGVDYEAEMIAARLRVAEQLAIVRERRERFEQTKQEYRTRTGSWPSRKAVQS